jgi:hypothetical protein
MCFSPEVSFASAGVLVGLGCSGLYLAQYRPGYWAFALIPVGFGLQQLAEGVVWLGVRQQNESLMRAGAAAFLFFALGVWPTWFAVAAALAEPGRVRRRLLWCFALATTVWLWVVYLPALTGPPAGLSSSVVQHSIHYRYGDEYLLNETARVPVTVLYSLCIIVPLLLMSRWRTLLLPIVLGTGSVVFSAWIFAYAYMSVWCFFAALLSVYTVYFIATAQATVPA